MLDWFFFPTFSCPACLKRVRNKGLCAECQTTLYENTYACPTCALPMQSDSNIQCSLCYTQKALSSQTKSPYLYGGAAKDLVYQFKTLKNFAAFRTMCSISQASFDEILETNHLVIPIPLHRSKLAKRGFNQSRLLAITLVKRSQTTAKVAQWMVRPKNTKTQGRLSKVQRLHNLEMAFRIRHDAKKRILGKKLLLVDDVLTTGATIRQATKVLVKHGAKEVKVWTFCRADN